MTAFAWLSEGEKLDCSKCTARDKEVRGCNGERRWVVGSTYVFGCPNKLLTQDVMHAVDAWARWKRFGWPYAGGWAEQPAKYVDAIEVLEIESAAADARRVERQKNGNSN